MTIERLSLRALRLFDRCGEKLFPHAQSLGANRILSATVPLTAPALRFGEIQQVKLPSQFAMAALDRPEGDAPPAGSGATPAPESSDAKALALGKAIVNCLSSLSRIPSRVASASVNALKATFVGSVGGRVSILRTAAKVLGLASLLSTVAFVAVSGPVGSLSLVATGPLAALLYFVGRSKKEAPPAEPRKRCAFWRVEHRIPGRVRTLMYGGYGLSLFMTGLITSSKDLMTKIAVPAAGLLILAAHLLSRHTVKKKLLGNGPATPEPSRRHQTA